MSEAVMETMGKFSDQKTTKGAQVMSGMFKSLLSAVPGGAILSGIFDVIVEVTPVMKLFEAVFKVIQGLFGIMGAQTVPMLMRVFQPFIQMLMSLVPVFVMVGQFIGIFLQMALFPLRFIIMMLSDAFNVFLPLIEAFNPALIAINQIIGILLEAGLAPFAHILTTMFLPVIKAIIPYIQAFAGWLLDIAKLLGYKPSGSSGRYQSGTDYVPRTGSYILEKGEKVGRRGGSSQEAELLSELVTLQKKQIRSQQSYASW